MRPATNRLRFSAEGLEKFCIRCVEWWPADTEFFFSDPEGQAGLFYCCKACYREWQASTKTKSRRALPGQVAQPAPALASIAWLRQTQLQPAGVQR